MNDAIENILKHFSDAGLSPKDIDENAIHALTVFGEELLNRTVYPYRSGSEEYSAMMKLLLEIVKVNESHIDQDENTPLSEKLQKALEASDIIANMKFPKIGMRVRFIGLEWTISGRDSFRGSSKVLLTNDVGHGKQSCWVSWSDCEVIE